MTGQKRHAKRHKIAALSALALLLLLCPVFAFGSSALPMYSGSSGASEAYGETNPGSALAMSDKTAEFYRAAESAFTELMAEKERLYSAGRYTALGRKRMEKIFEEAVSSFDTADSISEINALKEEALGKMLSVDTVHPGLTAANAALIIVVAAELLLLSLMKKKSGARLNSFSPAFMLAVNGGIFLMEALLCTLLSVTALILLVRLISGFIKIRASASTPKSPDSDDGKESGEGQDEA